MFLLPSLLKKTKLLYFSKGLWLLLVWNETSFVDALQKSCVCV